MEWKDFCREAYALGFAGAGLCPADAFPVQEEQVCAQAPLAERKQLRFYPQEDDKRIRSIAVLTYPYQPYRLESEDEVFVDSYYEASNAAYHAAVKLERLVLEVGRYARANVSYPAKEAAVRAGLGMIGKNSLLITPEHGSRVVIILLGVDFETDMPGKKGTGKISCSECGMCYAACPSGALDENGMSHPERCLRNFMMEGVVMPEALREANGRRLIGCDICQRVCPMQPEAENAAPKRFYLKDFMTDDTEAFSSAARALASVIGRNAARPQRIRAQASLLAGVMRRPAYLPVLEAWSSLPFEAVKEHAQWACRRIREAHRETESAPTEGTENSCHMLDL